VHDGEKRDGTGRGLRLGARLGFDRLELAAGRAVDGVPSAGAQLLPNCVRSFKIAISPALDALGEEFLSLFFIRSSWL
jgi:hypothetical protein